MLLECVVAEMNEAFKGFYQTATIFPGLHPSLIRELRKAAKTFSSLIESVTLQSDPVTSNGRNTNVLASAKSSNVVPVNTGASGEPLFETLPLDTVTEPTSASQSQALSTDMTELADLDALQSIQGNNLGAVLNTGIDHSGLLQTPYALSNSETQQTGQSIVDLSPTVPHAIQQDILQHHDTSVLVTDVVAPELPQELELPNTYSFLETSFTRRLIRLSLEAAYRLLMNPKPEEMDRLCTFSYCFINKPTLSNYFRTVMGRTAQENLELWSVPLYHIGNAGLHYPRDGIDASSPAPPWWADKASMGPSLPRQGPAELPDTMTATDIVNYCGVDGEWFDSNDVEQYLRTWGLQLDAQSSLVEFKDRDVINQEVYQGQSQRMPSSSAEFSNPLTSWPMDASIADDALLEHTNSAYINPHLDTTNLADLDLELELEASPGNVTSDTLSQQNLDGDLFALPFTRKPRRIFDVDAFLECESSMNWHRLTTLTAPLDIVHKSTCLGRTLCFRKSTVDLALHDATREIF